MFAFGARGARFACARSNVTVLLADLGLQTPERFLPGLEGAGFSPSSQLLNESVLEPSKPSVTSCTTQGVYPPRVTCFYQARSPCA